MSETEFQAGAAMTATIELMRKAGTARRRADSEGGLAIVEEWLESAKGMRMIIHTRSGLMVFGVDSYPGAMRARSLLLEICDWTRAGKEIATPEVKKRVDEIERLLWLEGFATGGGIWLKKPATEALAK